jgi:hypothetical protein
MPNFTDTQQRHTDVWTHATYVAMAAADCLFDESIWGFSPLIGDGMFACLQ